MDDGSLPPWTRHEEQGDLHPDPPDDSSPSSPNIQSASSFSFGGINTSQESGGIATGHVEEEDICRVCRENTPGVPLLHPWYFIPSIRLFLLLLFFEILYFLAVATRVYLNI